MGFRLALVLPVLVLLAGCGGSKSSTSGVTTTGSALVARVDEASATQHGKLVTATAKVTYGGKAGRKLVVRWGLVDAVSGLRASQGEKVITTLTTTPDVRTRTFSVTFNPGTSTDYIVHFSLATPSGVFAGAKDTDVFTYK